MKFFKKNRRKKNGELVPIKRFEWPTYKSMRTAVAAAVATTTNKVEEKRKSM